MKLHPEAKPSKSQLPWRMFFTVPGRVARTKGSVAEKARKGDRKPPRKKGVTPKTVWDTSSNWLEGPPLLWRQEKHLPHASSRQLLTCSGLLLWTLGSAGEAQVWMALRGLLLLQLLLPHGNRKGWGLVLLPWCPWAGRTFCSCSSFLFCRNTCLLPCCP